MTKLITEAKESIDKNIQMKKFLIPMPVNDPYSIAMIEIAPRTTEAPARRESFHPSSTSTKKEIAVTVEIPRARRNAPNMKQKTVWILFSTLFFLERKKSIGIMEKKRTNVAPPTQVKIVDCHGSRETLSNALLIFSSYQKKGIPPTIKENILDAILAN